MKTSAAASCAGSSLSAAPRALRGRSSRLSLGHPHRSGAGAGLPACSRLLVHHSGCSYCCRRLKTEDVASSSRRKALLPSLTAFKGKHPFSVCVLRHANVGSDLKKCDKGLHCSPHGVCGWLAGTGMFWQCVPAWEQPAMQKPTVIFAELDQRLCTSFPPGTAWTHGGAWLLGEAQLLLSFSPRSTKLWEAKSSQSICEAVPTSPWRQAPLALQAL